MGAGLSWGLSDFLGGLKSRRIALLAVLLTSQVVGLALIGGFVAVRGEGPPGGDFAVYAALGGLAGTVGIGCFYRGLAVGAMGVVAPISGLAAALPVVVGVAGGERPSGLQITGILLALVGVALASREANPAASDRDGERRPAARARLAGGVGLALVSAIGFGTFFVFIDRASEGDPAWALLTSKVVGLTVIIVLFAALAPSPQPARADLPALAAVGTFDIAGQGLFAVATTEGLLSVVSVLASLYPVITIVLARIVLGERLRALQRVGAVGALAGVGLITGG